MSPSVSIIIPAHNAAVCVGETVRAAAGCGLADEIIVVDDGSEDDTARVAGEAGATVARLSVNRGKGAALDHGASLARGEILVFLDADLGETAAEARRLVDPVREGRADMTVAVFPRPSRRGGFGLVVGAARFGLERLTGLRLLAPLSGQRAMTRTVYAAVRPCAPGFGAEVGLTIDASRAGFRILEVETGMAHAATGRDLRGFLHRGRQFVAVIRVLGHRAVRRRKAGWASWRAG